MKEAADLLVSLLELAHPPVAIAFRDAPPPGVERIGAAAPAGCAYWLHASEGHVFYTEASDHHNCAVGCHTHNVELPPERQAEGEALVKTMIGLGYLREDEVVSIPRRAARFGVAVYAPLALLPYEPDVVLVRGTPRQAMLLEEARRAAGMGASNHVLGRPACAVIPEAERAAALAVSLGCVGNRVNTGLGDHELVVAFPGSTIEPLVGALPAIVRANRDLDAFHRRKMAGVA